MKSPPSHVNAREQSQNTRQNAKTPQAPAPPPAALAMHNNFRNALQCLKRDLVRSIYYLQAIYDRKVYRMLGYSNIRDYAAQEGGLSEAQCRAFLKIGARMRDLPLMREALEHGSLSWHKASLIVDHIKPENQAEFIAAAQSLSTRVLRDRPHQGLPQAQPAATPPTLSPVPSSSPTTPPPAECMFFTLRFTPEQYALATRLLQASPGATKEEKILHALAATDGQGPAVTLPYLLVIMQCPDCGQAAIASNRGEIPVSRALLEAAHCDAAIEDAAGNRRRTIPTRLRRKVLQRARFSCESAGCSHTQFLEVHHSLPTAAGGGDSMDNLVVLCSRCHRRLHESEEQARAVLRCAP